MDFCLSAAQLHLSCLRAAKRREIVMKDPSIYLGKPTVLRHLIGENQSIRSNDEILAGSLYHFFGDKRDLVGDQNMFDLHHQALNQANIASRDAKDGGNGLLIGKIVGMGRHPMTPALIQEKTRLVVGEWLHLVIKSDA